METNILLIVSDYYDYQITASSIVIYFEYQVRKIKLAEAIFRSISFQCSNESFIVQEQTSDPCPLKAEVIHRNKTNNKTATTGKN